MGGSIARAFPSLQTSREFYGNQNLQRPDASLGGRRGVPGGPLLPTLPPNPLAVAARRMTRLSAPMQPKSLDRMFESSG